MRSERMSCESCEMFEDQLAALKLILNEQKREIDSLYDAIISMHNASQLSRSELINENEKLKEELKKELRNESNT